MNLLRRRGARLLEFVLGSQDVLDEMKGKAGLEPFSEDVISFCDTVSKKIMHNPDSRQYPDVITLGFWLRRASTTALKERFADKRKHYMRLGRGVAFHIAPSNVPVNFAYSLFASLLCGNANVVRMPSRNFQQAAIIVRAIADAVKDDAFGFSERICLVKYGHSDADNDALSALCDVRIIWGGDQTIAKMRQSPLPPRSTEVTFADRFSAALFDIEKYRTMDAGAKNTIARKFYNDTYLSDQNACTSPKCVFWLLRNKDALSIEQVEKTVGVFWKRLWSIVENEYVFQDIQGVDKLTKLCLLAQVANVKFREISGADNRLMIVDFDNWNSPFARENFNEYFGNSGYFLEFFIDRVSDLKSLCNDSKCQTVSYLGDTELAVELAYMGSKGVDRIVPVGNTMNFDLIWDGYNLLEEFTRVIKIE